MFYTEYKVCDPRCVFPLVLAPPEVGKGQNTFWARKQLGNRSAKNYKMSKASSTFGGTLPYSSLQFICEGVPPSE